MEIKLFLKIKKSASLPLNNNYLIQSMIYEVLKENFEFAIQLHDTGYDYDKRTYKMFTFSNLIGHYKIKDKEMVFDNSLLLKIRTIDEKIFRQLLFSFSMRKCIRIGALECYISKVESLNLDLTGTDYEINMISPIVVRSSQNGKTHFYNPLEQEFQDRLNDNLKRKYEAYYGVPLDEKFSIECLDFSRKMKVVTKYKGYYITAWRGKYLIKGSQKILNFLYQVGIGEKNAMGFGMFDI